MILSLYLLCVSAYGDVFPANTHYQVCFTPASHCDNLIINHINQAQQSIYIQTYAFSHWKIADALVRAHKRGIKVLLISDKINLVNKYGKQLRYLLKKHIPVWIDNKVNIAHNKLMIIDKHIVETGSFNYTWSAQHYNAENVLIINNKSLAQQYLANWLARQKKSYRLTKPPTKP